MSVNKQKVESYFVPIGRSGYYGDCDAGHDTDPTIQTCTVCERQFAGRLPSQAETRDGMVFCSSACYALEPYARRVRGLGLTLRCAEVYDAMALFGEVGWIIGSYPGIDNYVDRFLELADDVNEGKTPKAFRMVDMLERMEQDGHPVDWEACLLENARSVVGARRPWWKRLLKKIKNSVW